MGHQYCFLAGLKSVVDKDGGDILVGCIFFICLGSLVSMNSL